ncbi:type IV pilin protein [Sideroxydans lithotrophicus]|uniref:Putative type 4 fimbrial biogenesis transmembrane protein n=1 Tax=Sideroxydans lithotrophicus (strain ES-1) TaxID=580332 RepID=D5CUK8_SIDLE|nr:type IV pilin protein [Sideroxydans lithotrophicus]ADE12395.1 putative type 4 fimbrial biogenesis transmembrane protein [Sideroxydans lithotrophicus ES-1]
MKFQNGFTLIELMVVVVIAGVIAAIAYPSYLQYLTRNNRSAAESYMLGVANKEEQYVLDVRQYFSAPTTSAGCSNILAGAALTSIGITPPASVSKNYSIDICANSAATPATYLITATPTGTQLANDTKCGSLTLKQDGTKGMSTASPVTSCW